MIKMLQEEIRKGPWTEQEDILLMNFVGLFGDRRWDFIAKVSGLKRTGKSCRLRWVNYLHPGLKRGKMTPQEERLVLELHAKWGNRWSRIARKLPGRTDNEIKNYWRTHMRKKAQERKRSAATSPPSSSFSTCSPSSTVTTVDSSNGPATGKASFYDTGGHDDVVMAALAAKKCGHDYQQVEEYEMGTYSMDDIWKEIEMSEENENTIIKPVVCDGYGEECCNFSCPSMAPPSLDYFCLDSLLRMDHEEECKMNIPPNFDQFVTSYGYGID